MPRNDLIGKRVAILATDGVEAVELIDPRNALDKVGAKTLVVSPNHDKIRSWEHGEWVDDIPIDLPLAKCSPDDFEALFLPGGVINATACGSTYRPFSSSAVSSRPASLWPPSVTPRGF